MTWLCAFLLVVIVVPACGQPSLQAVRPVVPMVAAQAVGLDTTSVKAEVREAVERFLARKHPGMTIDLLSVGRSVQNGRQAFVARCHSPRSVRRIDGHYDVATQVAMVDKDTPLP